LTGDGIDERLEECRKPWRLQATKSVRERSQVRISFRRSVPPGQIDTHSEETVNCAAEILPVELRPNRRRHSDNQARPGGPVSLTHGNFSRPTPQHHNATVGRTIPSVDRVSRATAQSPHGEVKAERRHWSENDRGLHFGAPS